MLGRWTLPWAAAKDHLWESLRSGEKGEPVGITRNGKPLAQLVPPPTRTRVVRFGSIAGRIHFRTGWDEAMEVDHFLSGKL